MSPLWLCKAPGGTSCVLGWTLIPPYTLILSPVLSPYPSATCEAHTPVAQSIYTGRGTRERSPCRTQKKAWDLGKEIRSSRYLDNHLLGERGVGSGWANPLGPTDLSSRGEGSTALKGGTQDKGPKNSTIQTFPLLQYNLLHISIYRPLTRSKFSSQYPVNQIESYLNKIKK